MFAKSFEASRMNYDIKINEHKHFEWAITNTGDYALEYTLWFYLERIPNTQVTATIRKHLMGTIYKIDDAVYTQSVIENIQLATPYLNSTSIYSLPAKNENSSSQKIA